MLRAKKTAVAALAARQLDEASTES